MIRDLTQKQRDVLRFIHHGITVNGRCPSNSQIAEFLGGVTNAAAVQQVQALERSKCVERADPGTPWRGIRLLDRAYEELAIPSPGQMKRAVEDAARLRDLLIRCWSLLTIATPVSPILDELRKELGQQLPPERTPE